jgi:hypothetical protein
LFDNVEHRLIIHKHIRPKLVDTSGLREDRQMLEQLSANALALALIQYQEGNFGLVMVRSVVIHDVSGHTYEFPRLATSTT